jgi:hypothetical protein
MLSDDHRKNGMGAALTFLECHHRNGDKFLNHIVTGDETWVSHFTPEIKCQSLEWHDPRAPSKSRSLSRHCPLGKSWPWFFGTGKASWLSSCHKAQPSMQKRIVQL